MMPGRGFGQGFGGGAPPVGLPPVAPREATSKLRRAAEAVENERLADAVVLLGDLARGDASDDDLPPQDYLLASPDGNPSDDSLRAEVRRRIGELPSAGRELYRQRYGAAARRDLEAAIEAGDRFGLEAVRRRYFHTEAGYQASALLAMDAWGRGAAQETAILLEDVADSVSAVEQLGQDVVVLKAAARRRAGLSVSPDVGGREVIVDGRRERVPTADGSDVVEETSERSRASDVGEPAEVARWIDERFPPVTASSLAGTFEPGTLTGGGDDGQMPLSEVRYDLPTAVTPWGTRTVREAARAWAAGGRYVPPSWSPLVVGDWLLMRTSERLLGIDHRTGKRVWTYPWQSPLENYDEDSLESVAGDDGERRRRLLLQRVYNDVPYGQLSTDGRAVYMIDDLELADDPMTGRSRLRRFPGGPSGDDGGNVLVALELATEGKLLWRIGGDDEFTAGHPLTGAFFLGPPLAVGGELFVMAENAGDVVLACLDADDGSLRWSQTLLSIESMGVSFDPPRRASGAMVSYADGVLVCPTGAGAVVAVDRADRQLRWVYRYPRKPLDRSAIRMGRGGRAIMGGGRFGEGSADGDVDPPALDRWDHGVASVAGDAVIVTPPESNRVMVLDLWTGRGRFPMRERGQMRYLAGARGGLFVLVGPRIIRGHDLKTGRVRWTTNRWPGGPIVGRGMFRGDDYVVPTADGQLIAFSVSRGTVTERRPIRFEPGNLVVAGDDIVSAGPTTVSVAHGERSLRGTVAATLAESPDDVDGLLLQSQLLMQRGRRGEALATLAEVRRRRPDDLEVRLRSIDVMLQTMRDGEDPGRDAVASLDELLPSGPSRIEFLDLRMRRSVAAGRWVEAAEDLVEWSALVLDRSVGETHPVVGEAIPAADGSVAGRSGRGVGTAGTYGAIGSGGGRTVVRDAAVAGAAAELARRIAMTGGAATKPRTDADDGGREVSNADRQSVERLLSDRLRRYRDGRPGADRVLRHLRSLAGAEAIDAVTAALIDAQAGRGDLLRCERLYFGGSTLDRPPVDLPASKRRLVDVLTRGGFAEEAARIRGLGSDNADGSADAGDRSDGVGDRSDGVGDRFDGVGDRFGGGGAEAIDGGRWATTATLRLKTPEEAAGRRRSPFPRMLTTRQSSTGETLFADLIRGPGNRFDGCQLISTPQTPASIRDRHGRLRALLIDDPAAYPNVERSARVGGGLLVLQTDEALIAIDLYSALPPDFVGGADSPGAVPLGPNGLGLPNGRFGIDGSSVRWTHPLAAGGAAVSRGSRSTPLGDRVARYTTAGSAPAGTTPEVVLGPIVGDRVFLLRAGTLSALSVDDGTVLWRRSDAPSSGRIVTDGHRVAVVEDGDNREGATAVLYAAADGRVLGRRPQPHGDVWAASDRYVLATRTVGANRYVLTLFDPINGLELETLPTFGTGRVADDQPAAAGRVVDGRYLTTLSTDGSVHAWDLLEGRSMWKQNIGRRDDLESLTVLAMDDTFVLMPADRGADERSTIVREPLDSDGPRRPTRSGMIPASTRLSTADGRNHRTVDAAIALNRDDGKILWSREFDRPWGCTIGPPPASPVIVLARRRRDAVDAMGPRSRRQTAEVRMLAVADGRTVATREGLAPARGGGPALSTRIVVDRAEDAVDVTVGPFEMRLEFGDESSETDEASATDEASETEKASPEKTDGDE